MKKTTVNYRIQEDPPVLVEEEENEVRNCEFSTLTF